MIARGVTRQFVSSTVKPMYKKYRYVFDMQISNFVKSANVDKLLSVYKNGSLESLCLCFHFDGDFLSEEWLCKFKNHYLARGYKGNISFFISQDDFFALIEDVNITVDLLHAFLKNISGLISSVNYRLINESKNSIPNLSRDVAFCFAKSLLKEYHYKYSCDDYLE